MKTPKKIPTLFALLILITLISLLSLISFSSRRTTEINVSLSSELTITNVTDSQFTIFFLTQKPTLASLKYGPDKNKLVYEALDERDELANRQSERLTHYITVSNLQPETNYYFTYKAPANEEVYQVTTGPVLAPPLQTIPPIYGQIIDKNNQPIEEGIVLIKFSQAQLVSALVKPSGNFLISQDVIRNQAKNALAQLSSSSEGEMTIFDGQNSSGGFFQIGQHSPLPTIVFGQAFDLRPAAFDQALTTPLVSKETRKALRSGFANLIGSAAVGVDSKTATIIFPNPSASFIEPRPVFKGTAQPNKVVTITINSSQSLMATIYTDNNGLWQFQPPEDLEPGVHTLTVVLTDAQGQLQTLTRSFTVLAAEPSVIPATFTPTATSFPPPTSTPAAGMSAPTQSPTPIPTRTPTPAQQPTPTPTPPAVTSPTSTPKPTPPVSGLFDNSLLLVILGGLLTTIGSLSIILKPF